jgi:hypothetical protein
MTMWFRLLYFVCAYARLLNNGCHRAGCSHGDSPHGGMLVIDKIRESHVQTHSQALQNKHGRDGKTASRVDLIIGMWNQVCLLPLLFHF